jgi:hypothetical protein
MLITLIKKGERDTPATIDVLDRQIIYKIGDIIRYTSPGITAYFA